MFEIGLAWALGLDPADAEPVSVSTADGSPAPMMRWPGSRVSMEFADHRSDFKGQFVDSAAGGTFQNLLGREDFFSGLVVQFWNDRALFNVDASPDAPQDALGWTT